MLAEQNGLIYFFFCKICEPQDAKMSEQVLSPSCNYRIPLFCDSQYISGQLDHSYTKGGGGGIGLFGFSGFCKF